MKRSRKGPRTPTFTAMGSNTSLKAELDVMQCQSYWHSLAVNATNYKENIQILLERKLLASTHFV